MVLLTLGGHAAAAERADEQHAWLMASTFRIESPGSIGTALILGRPVADAPEQWQQIMVTSDEVLKRVIGDGATLVMREPDGTGGWRRRGVPVRIRRSGKPLWVRHADADVAAMSLELPAEVVPKPLLHVDVLATDERLEQAGLHPGDELFCLGYPFGLEASPAGFPILQRGTVASYPLLPSRDVKTFLFDVNLFPGHSGGPVYLSPKPMLAEGRLTYSSIKSIVGLLSEERAIQKQIAGMSELSGPQHPLGLARVIHASLVRETIDLLPAARPPPPAAPGTPGASPAAVH